MVLPYVNEPGAAAHTRATFVIEDRVPGLQKIADTPTPAPGARTGLTDLGPETVRQETERP